jgi:hypothetical protein
MTVSHSDGTQTATISTPYAVATITPDGSYALQLNLANMALGDVFTVTEGIKVRSVGTTATTQSSRFAHVQAEPVKIFIPRPSTNEVVYTVTQTAGTGRTFTWEVVQLDA